MWGPFSPGKCEKVHVDFVLPKGTKTTYVLNLSGWATANGPRTDSPKDRCSLSFPVVPYRYTGEDETDDGPQELDFFEATDGEKHFHKDIGGAADAARSGAPKTDETDGKVVISGKDFLAYFSKLSGSFELLEHKGKKHLLIPAQIKIFCNERLLPAFCSAELSVDGELAVINEVSCLRWPGVKAENRALWPYDFASTKWAGYPSTASVPSGDFETDGNRA